MLSVARLGRSASSPPASMRSSPVRASIRCNADKPAPCGSITSKAAPSGYHAIAVAGAGSGMARRSLPVITCTIDCDPTVAWYAMDSPSLDHTGMEVAGTSIFRTRPVRSRSNHPVSVPRRPRTATSPEGRITTCVTSSTPAHTSMGSTPCSTSIRLARSLFTNTRRRPSGDTDVARAKYSSNHVVASWEWMTWDVTGAGGTGGGVHATAARMSQYSEAILMGIYGGDKQGCHPERSEGSAPTQVDPSVATLPQDDRRPVCAPKFAASRTILTRLCHMRSLNTFGARAPLRVDGTSYTIWRLSTLAALSNTTLERLPVTLRILLENLLRNEDNAFVKASDIETLARWNVRGRDEHEIAFRTSRVLLQDFTGVPAVVDLAAMRDAIVRLGGDPKRINPLQPVDLVIDHSVQVDEYGSDAAFLINAEKEFERNRERYVFLRWGQNAFRSFRVVPPGTGICHQVNLEYLGQVVFRSEENGEVVAYPDSLVGTDSHTTMINGLGVLGWGVGGIEAEAAMLGQPLSMLIP